jgi:hypothetical protein
MFLNIHIFKYLVQSIILLEVDMYRVGGHKFGDLRLRVFA